jgi:D-alanyl-D-alanine carboxypeptidase/D-alanyl-D-alanine-endopeptidase (penicillin-binding protein 4)
MSHTRWQAPEHAAQPSHSRSILEAALCDPRLADVRILLEDADTGAELYARKADAPTPTASVMKLLTGAAALTQLEPPTSASTAEEPWRITTRAYLSPDCTTITIVGAGDVTMTRQSEPATTFYPSPARVSQFAKDTAHAVKRFLSTCHPPDVAPPTQLALDVSLFADSQWHDSWDAAGRCPENYISFISALQLDGDRIDPLEDDSPRSENPAAVFGHYFAKHYARHFERLTHERNSGLLEIDCDAKVDPAAIEIAHASSAPLEQLIHIMERVSDNTLAESLARLVAKARGLPPNFTGLGSALLAVADQLGLPTAHCTVIDGSGLSTENRLTPRLVTQLVRMAYRDEWGLGRLYSRMTQTGDDETFSSRRFVGKNRVIGDAIRAKTGYIGTVHSMAGTVRTHKNRNIAFALFAVADDISDSARDAVDDLLVRLHLNGDLLMSQPNAGTSSVLR